MFRAGGANFCLKVKVLWKVAFNTLHIREEWLIWWTLTCIFQSNIVSASTTFLATFYWKIEIKILRARLASIINKHRLFCWTSYTRLNVGIIKKIFSTVFASFILIVKIFGEEASYARIWAFEWFWKRTYAELNSWVKLFSFLAIFALL